MPRARREAKPAPDVPTSQELLEGLLTLEGSTGSTYSRFHRYSPRNIGFLALQGCPPEPVATYKRWAELGFHVKKGEKAFSILRPIQVKIEKEDSDEPTMIRRFKVVRALFHYAQVAGEGELPPYVPPTWDVDQALANLDIERMPFESYSGNIGGYAINRQIAINPVAPYPLRTTLHEISHIQNGHTTPENLALYQEHRGTYEFEAEASAHVVLNEIGELTPEVASVSRGYVQSWMKDQQPTEASLRKILNTATTIEAAGRVDVVDSTSISALQNELKSA